VVLLILRLGSVLDAGFDQVYIFYNPLVMSVSDIIDTWVYRMGLEQLNFSLGAAVGLFKSVIGIFLIGGSNFIAKRLGGQGLW
jgi:putative aldouronate transport system permease protein